MTLKQWIGQNLQNFYSVIEGVFLKKEDSTWKKSGHGEGAVLKNSSGTIAYDGASVAEGTGNVTLTAFTISGAAGATTYTTSAPHNLRIGNIISLEENSGFASIETVPSETSFTVAATLSTSALTNHPLYLHTGISFGIDAHSEGRNTTANGGASHAEGELTIAGTRTGVGSHAEGQSTLAYGEGAHAEGYESEATNLGSHAEGLRSKATAQASHAEGNSSIASGSSSHAEGRQTTASGSYSHAEGYSTVASGGRAHAEGYGTLANTNNSHAEGLYNESHVASSTWGDAGNTLHSIGIGTGNNARKNAFEIMQNGDVYVKGIGSYDGTNPTSGVNDLATVVENIPQETLESAKGLWLASDLEAYNPTKASYLEVTSDDETVQIKSLIKTEKTNPDTGEKYDLVTAKFSAPLVKQSETISNNNYPLAIAGRQYQNMESGKAYQTYYSQNIQANPATGVLSANDVNLQGMSATQALASISETAGEVIIGTHTAATVNWTGVSKLPTASAMKSGYRFTYWLPYTGASGGVVLTLTFQDGTTKAINCYFRGATRLTTHIPAGNKVDFLYLENASVGTTAYTGAWIDPGYQDGNYYDRLLSNYARPTLYSASAPLYRYKFCGFREGKIIPLVITNQTSATMVDKTPTTFGIDPTRGIVYYNSATTCNTAGHAISAQSLYDEIPTTAPYYTFNDALPIYSDIYLKGIIGSDGYYYLDTTTHKSWYVFAPNNPDVGAHDSVFMEGCYYMFLGTTYSSTNYFQFKLNNPVYQFLNGRLEPYVPVSQSKVENVEFTQRKSPSMQADYVTLKSIKGNTIVWNQLVQDGDFTSGSTVWAGDSAATVSFSDNTAHVSGSSTAGNSFQPNLYPRTSYRNKFIVGHKYLFIFEAKAGSNSTITTLCYRAGTTYSSIELQTSWVREAKIYTATDASLYLLFWHYVAASSTISTADFYVRNVNLFDLTLMFGAGKEPATVEEFERLFPEPYYNYSDGTLMSFNGNGIETVGRNLWDEEWRVGNMSNAGVIISSGSYFGSKNFINILGGETYYFHRPKSVAWIYWYTNSGEFIDLRNYGKSTSYQTLNNSTYEFAVPDGAGKMHFLIDTVYGTVYNNDICISLSDPATNGTYEPYKKAVLSFPEPDTWEMSDGSYPFEDWAGMCSAGNIYDEAIVDEDGYIRTVIKRVGQVDMGSITWSKETYGGHTRFYSAIQSDYNGALTRTNVLASDHFVSGSTSPVGSYDMIETICGYSNNRFYVLTDKFGSLSALEFQTAMADSYIYYELATPLTYTLTTPIYVGSDFYNGGIQKMLYSLMPPFRGSFEYSYKPNVATLKAIDDAVKIDADLYVEWVGGASTMYLRAKKGVINPSTDSLVFVRHTVVRDKKNHGGVVQRRKGWIKPHYYNDILLRFAYHHTDVRDNTEYYVVQPGIMQYANSRFVNEYLYPTTPPTVHWYSSFIDLQLDLKAFSSDLASMNRGGEAGWGPARLNRKCAMYVERGGKRISDYMRFGVFDGGYGTRPGIRVT